MSDLIGVMHSHRSDRSFKPDPVSEADLDAILKAAWLGPSSINGQQVSVVVVRDAARRAKLAEIAGGQRWVAEAPVFLCVVVDFYKTSLGVEKAGEVQQVHESLEGIVAGALDAGIALGNMMTASRALGYGIVPIGGIRRNPLAVVELLGLPRWTFPINGMCLGRVDRPADPKPRLPMQTFRHDETYNPAILPAAIEAYDAALAEHWKKTGRANGQPWSSSIAEAYKYVYYRETRTALEKQGFKFDR